MALIDSPPRSESTVTAQFVGRRPLAGSVASVHPIGRAQLESDLAYPQIQHLGQHRPRTRLVIDAGGRRIRDDDAELCLVAADHADRDRSAARLRREIDRPERWCCGPSAEAVADLALDRGRVEVTDHDQRGIASGVVGSPERVQRIEVDLVCGLGCDDPGPGVGMIGAVDRDERLALELGVLAHPGIELLVQLLLPALDPLLVVGTDGDQALEAADHDVGVDAHARTPADRRIGGRAAAEPYPGAAERGGVDRRRQEAGRGIGERRIIGSQGVTDVAEDQASGDQRHRLDRQDHDPETVVEGEPRPLRSRPSSRR